MRKRKAASTGVHHAGGGLQNHRNHRQEVAQWFEVRMRGKSIEGIMEAPRCICGCEGCGKMISTLPNSSWNTEDKL